ncbi:hypothetical protein B0T14DRAFT_525681 [Immersiella caudata]|uniref:Clr5 domain-containing protein n=1 Tax=Immersiella caudata TaxID=314043 RepID=A0AA39WLV6_9PEZI|nr:hypothetical protein B0T14DRAFT_525681 [Immersiella caudata]
MNFHPNLAGDARFTSYAFEMVGTSAEKARPCIIVFCRKEPKFFETLTACFGKRARKLLYCDKKAPPVPPLRIVYYRTDYPVSRKAAYTMVLERHLSERTWCGSLVRFGGRTATLGLTIRVGHLVGVLTVDHLFSLSPCEARVDLEDVEMTEDEINAMATDESSALWLDGAGDYLDISDDDESPTPEGSSSGVKAMSLDDGSPATSDPLEMWERITPPCEPPSSEPYLDWSLARLTDGSMLQHGNFIFPEGERNPVALTSLYTGPRTDSTSVYIVSGIRGILYGRLSAGSAMLGSAPGRKLCETWTVFLDSGSEILHGECGSLVVDQATYEVYGHVVASGPNGLIHAVPLKNVFAQIGKSFETENISFFSINSTPRSLQQGDQGDLLSALAAPIDRREAPALASRQSVVLEFDSTNSPTSADKPTEPMDEEKSPIKRGTGVVSDDPGAKADIKAMDPRGVREQLAPSREIRNPSAAGISGLNAPNRVTILSPEVWKKDSAKYSNLTHPTNADKGNVSKGTVDKHFRVFHSDIAGVRSTARIPQEMWEEHKDIILAKYQRSTLVAVKKEMEEEYGFCATTRQLVHHIGTVWGVKKYNKGSGVRDPSVLMRVGPEVPVTAPSHSQAPLITRPSQSEHWRETRLLLLADIFFACGDPSAWRLYSTLSQETSTKDQGPLSRLIACIRASQTPRDLEISREYLQDQVDAVLSEADDNSSLDALVDLMAARTYDDGKETPDALRQIEQMILRITEEEDRGGGARLKDLQPRKGITFDVPLYLFMAYAIARWNEESDARKDGQHLDTEALLRQFVQQQLQVESSNMPGPYDIPSLIENQKQHETFKLELRDVGALALTERLPSLFGCREFFLEIALRIRTRQGSWMLQHSSPVYQLLSTLWQAWMELSGVIPTTEWWPESRLSVEWAQHAERELGISGAEVLATMVSMTMAPVDVGTTSARASSDVIMSIAASRMSNLYFMPDVDFFNLFLEHIRSADALRWAARDQSAWMDPEEATLVHSFFCTTLGLPEAGQPVRALRVLEAKLPVVESTPANTTTSSGLKSQHYSGSALSSLQSAKPGMSFYGPKVGKDQTAFSPGGA